MSKANDTGQITLSGPMGEGGHLSLLPASLIEIFVWISVAFDLKDGIDPLQGY